MLTRFSITVSAYSDWFRQIGTRSRGWWGGFRYCSAVRQITLSTVILS